MSALILQNNALWHIFEDFTASILLGACFLIYVIRNQFSNHPPIHDNKIANELSVHMTEINDILTAEIKKNEARDGSITAEIERLLTDGYKKLSTEVNTKIANELSMELDRINNDLNNNKLTGTIAKINSRDAGYASEAQKILSMVNNVTTRLDNIEEACRNDFGNISSTQRLHHSSSSESSSSRLSEKKIGAVLSEFLIRKKEWGILWIMRLKLLDVKFVNLLGKRLGRVL